MVMVYKRKYVENYPSAWDDALVSGFIYFENEPEPRFEDNLYINRIDHADGKYHLLIERNEWVSDDLSALEKTLFTWVEDALYPDEIFEIVDAN